ncbi:MAG: hypothetical protein IJW06_04345 [Clostridia bacterium]|nr:hypothetical protein [Clostridia bacterium]
MKKETLVFECPKCLSEAIVVPTGNVSVSGDIAAVEVWKDGKIVNINVNVTGTYPAVVADGKLSEEYALKICAAVKTENDVYNLVSLGYAQDENGTYIGLNKDKPELLDETELTKENMFFIRNDFEPVSPFRRVRRYYQGQYNSMAVDTQGLFLGDFSYGKYDFDITNWAGRRMRFDAGKNAFAQDFSRILVKYNYADKASKWVCYDAKALSFVDQIKFTTVSYIVSNNVKNGPEDESCMAGEDLVFLFGVVDVRGEKEIKLTLGEKATANVDAALYQTLRIRAKVNGGLSDELALFRYTRDDGVECQREFKLAMGGVDTEGYRILDICMREVQAWHDVISDITIILPEGKYELDYVKFLSTGTSSDIKLGAPLPMFSDGNFKKGFKIECMEAGLVPTDDYFATTSDGDKNRDEYEAAAKDDESNPKKYYADWKLDPLYDYDYINTHPFIKAAGMNYDTTKPIERLEAVKAADPEAYQKYYLDYEFSDNGKPTEEGFFITADKAGSKAVIYKPNQTYTTNDGVERHGDVLEITLNGKKLFNGQPYSKYDKNNNPDGSWRFWPHLLIEQNSGIRPVDFNTEIQYSTGADRLYCEFDIRIKHYSENYTRKVHPDGIERDTGHMSFLLYSYLRPKKNPGTLVWFGLNIATDNLYVTQNTDVNWCRDSGANTYMYCLQPEAVYSGFGKSLHNLLQNFRKAEGYTKGSVASSDWVHVKVDLTHHVGIILDRINSEDAYGLGITERSDWFFNGVNIGFETSDNVDCTVEMANFNYYSYDIEE